MGHVLRTALVLLLRLLCVYWQIVNCEGAYCHRLYLYRA